MTDDALDRRVIVIGASAGGVEALQTVVGTLPGDLNAIVLVVLHVPPHGTSVLPAILQRAGNLAARHAVDGEVLRPGAILVAPPDSHLVVRDSTAHVTRGPRENGHRPSVDVLFRSAARAAGVRVLGVVLSGVMDDGTAGAAAVHERGGTVIVQDPGDALYPNMPSSVIHNVPTDHVLPVADIGRLLTKLCSEDLTGTDPAPSQLMEVEAKVALMDEEALISTDRPGTPSGFSCPDCAGVLFEIRDGEIVRYRCRVGHAWSAESLLGEQADAVDSALWMALRSVEEKVALSDQLAERAEQRGSELTAKRYREQAGEAARAARVIRSMLQSPQLGAVRDRAGP